MKEIDFRLLLEQLPTIVWATDHELRFVYSRGAGLTTIGCGADEVVGLSLTEWLGTSDLADPTLAAHHAALGGVPTVYELEREGRVYRVHVEPWRAGSAAIGGVLGVALDITERARAELSLERSERILSDFFENAALGLSWVGSDGIILRVNRTELNLLGYSRDEYVGRQLADFHVDRDAIIGVLARVARGETVDTWEARLRACDGSIKHVLMSANVFRKNGRFVHVCCFTRDVTDRREMEKARREAELLQHVASLAHAAAHEINNPLAVISASVDLVARTAGPDAQPRLDACYEAIGRISDILERMNSVARLELAREWPPDLPPMLDLAASSARAAGVPSIRAGATR